MTKNEEKLKKSFGSALRLFRMNVGLSQETLAQEADLDRSFISMLERGTRQPSLTTIFDLSEALKIKPSELICLVEEHLSKK